MRITPLIKPNQWSCLATSFAMVLGITTERFYELAGHDGGEKIWPDIPDPFCRRGFHINEAVAIANDLGFTATPLELFPMIRVAPYAPYHGVEQVPVFYAPERNEEGNWRRFGSIINTRIGVVECQTRGGNWHAVAFNASTIFDPDGRQFPYSRQTCESRGLFTSRLWKVAKA